MAHRLHAPANSDSASCHDSRLSATHLLGASQRDGPGRIGTAASGHAPLLHALHVTPGATTAGNRDRYRPGHRLVPQDGCHTCLHRNVSRRIHRTARNAALRKQRFLEAGIDVSGCVTPTQVGKKSTGWNPISCYTDLATQDRLQQIFEFTAGLFDEIMIDDFWFTDCECQECQAARDAQTVTIGQQKYPVAGTSWEDYRCELLVQLSGNAFWLSRDA